VGECLGDDLGPLVSNAIVGQAVEIRQTPGGHMGQSYEVAPPCAGTVHCVTSCAEGACEATYSSVVRAGTKGRAAAMYPAPLDPMPL
jgi:hypothetical protein